MLNKCKPRPSARWARECVRLLAVASLAVIATACDGSTPLISSVPTPALYFILQLDASDAPSGDAYALAATAALPYDARYLSVQSVEAYRVSDGRRLAFDIVQRSGPVVPREFGSLPNYSSQDGNLRWRADGRIGMLGVRDVQPGDSIELRVVAEGTALQGAMRVPRRPVPSISIENGDRVLRLDGDAGTALWTAGGRWGSRSLNTLRFNIDSTLTPFELERADSIQVTAFDANAAAYLVPPFRDQAGVSGGLGVVGAVVSSRAVVLPPK